MRKLMDIFQKLRASRDLTESDRSIIAYVLDHPDEIGRLSSRELGRRTNTSASAVVRFCKHVGFESWSEFKLNVASELKRVHPGTTEMAAHEHALSATVKVAELENAVINEMRSTIDLEALQKVADLLCAVDEIDICAYGVNALIACYAIRLFALAGKMASAHDSIDSIIRFSLHAPTDHVAILISRGGIDTTLIEVAYGLKCRGLTIIALTTALSSPLAKLCDYTLGCYYGDLTTYGEIVYHVSACYVIDTLFTLLFSEDFEDNQHLIKKHYEVCSTRVSGNTGWKMDTMAQI